MNSVPDTGLNSIGTSVADDKSPTLAKNTAQKVAEKLSLFLGGSYSADTLREEASRKALTERLTGRLAAVELRRQSHIEAIALAAFEAANDKPAEDTSEQPSGETSESWLAHFLELAQDIADPDLQQVWGHVLASEIAEPGRVSIQVLDALGGMVAADLDLLEKVGRILFPTGYLLKLDGRNEFEDFGITEAHIQRLQNLGLIKPSDDLSVTFYAPTKGITFDYKGSDLIVRHPERQLFIMPAFQFTGTGLDTMKLLADVNVDMDYLTALGQSLRAQGYDYRIRDAMGALIEHV